MTAAHTPGPWSVPHMARPDVNCECGYVLTENLMGAVCTVHASGEGEDWQSHGDNPRFEEACANARLIAAAPDLFAALKPFAEQSPARDGMDDWDTTTTVVKYLRDAAAAFAKATGT